MVDYVVKLTKDATKVWKMTSRACARRGSTTAESCRSR